MIKIRGKTNHNYHLVTPSPWPFITAQSAFFAATAGIAYMRSYNLSIEFFYLALFTLIFSMSLWWRDVVSRKIPLLIKRNSILVLSSQAHLGDQTQIDIGSIVGAGVFVGVLGLSAFLLSLLFFRLKKKKENTNTCATVGCSFEIDTKSFNNLTLLASGVTSNMVEKKCALLSVRGERTVKVLAYSPAIHAGLNINNRIPFRLFALNDLQSFYKKEDFLAPFYNLIENLIKKGRLNAVSRLNCNTLFEKTKPINLFNNKICLKCKQHILLSIRNAQTFYF